jgi:hypothetical protein
MTEPVRGDSELDGHAEGTVLRGRGGRQRSVDRGGTADSFKEVANDCPLVVVRDDLSCFDEDIAGEPRDDQRIDDLVVEPQHRVVKLADDQVLVVPRIPNHGRVG